MSKICPRLRIKTQKPERRNDPKELREINRKSVKSIRFPEDNYQEILRNLHILQSNFTEHPYFKVVIFFYVSFFGNF